LSPVATVGSSWFLSPSDWDLQNAGQKNSKQTTSGKKYGIGERAEQLGELTNLTITVNDSSRAETGRDSHAVR